MAGEFDPDAYLKDDRFNPDEYLRRNKAPDAPFDPWRTAKQIPLGMARGIEHMAPIGAAQLQMENLTGLPAPTPEDYAPGLSKIIGGENRPRNPYERAASGVGESVPWSLSMSPGPVNLALGAAGGAGGSVAQEFVDDKHKPLAGIVGGLVSTIGAAGAMKVLTGMVNKFMPYSKLGGDAAEFGIPATEGMIAANPAKIAEEQAMQRGARGKPAQWIMQGQERARQDALTKAEEGLVTRTGGDPATPAEAASAVSGGVRGRAEDLRSSADALYESAKGKNAWAAADKFTPVVAIDDALTAENIILDRWNYPVSQQAYRVLKQLGHGTPTDTIGSAVDAMGPRVLSLREMDQARKKLYSLKASKPEDGMALGTIRKAYDAWEARMVDNALFVGDKTAIEDIRAARPLWRRYRQMTDADRKADYTKIVSNIVNNDRSPEEVARWILNTSSLDMSGRASRFARYIRRAFGENSDEWQSLRQGLLHTMLNPTLGIQPGQRAGSRAIAKSIDQAVDGKGAPLTRVLFSEEERDRLARYADALKRVTPPLANASGTGYEHARYAWPLITGAAGVGGLAEYHHTRDWRWLLLGAAPFLRNAYMANKAFNATHDIIRTRSMLRTPRAVPMLGQDEQQP